MCDLMSASLQIGLRWSKDYGKDMCIFVIVQCNIRSHANCCPSKNQRGYGHPRQAGAPEGTAGVDGTRISYGLRLFVVRCGICCTRMTPA